MRHGRWLVYLRTAILPTEAIGGRIFHGEGHGRSAIVLCKHKKMAPFLGPTFKRLRNGGQIQERLCKIPFRQWERHFGKRRGNLKRVKVILEFAASLVYRAGAFAEPKIGRRVILLTLQGKCLEPKEVEKLLASRWASNEGKKTGYEVQNNAYSMHAGGKAKESPWRGHGLDYRKGFSCCRRRCAACLAGSDREAMDR
jgi:hypothetical protein